jgi:hypothetical protein
MIGCSKKYQNDIFVAFYKSTVFYEFFDNSFMAMSTLLLIYLPSRKCFIFANELFNENKLTLLYFQISF